MPAFQLLYVWSRFSAIVILGFVGMRGIRTPKVEIEVVVPTEAGFGWEKNLWGSDETIRPDMTDSIQARIDKCNQVSENAPGMRTRLFCKIQKIKLQGLNHVLRFMRKAYSFASNVLPVFGGGGYGMICELLVFTGLMAFTMKTQHSSVKMLREKIYAVCKSGNIKAGQAAKPAPAGQVGKGKKDAVEEIKPMDFGGSHEADRLGTPGDEELAFSCPSGGRRFHGGLAFQEGMSDEVSASSGMSGSEVDGKTKKEVRFCDDAFDDHVTSDAFLGKTQTKASQRRVSPVKRILSEPVSKICGVKMTRSMSSGGAGAGSRSSWHP